MCGRMCRVTWLIIDTGVYSKGTPVRITVVKGVEKITTGNPALGTGFSDIQF